MALRPFVKDLYWLPADKANRAAVRRHFKLRSVPNSEGGEEIVCLWRIRRAPDGSKWIGLPRGRPDLIRRCLGGGLELGDFLDLRADPAADIPLTFNGTYRDYQIDAALDLADAESGVLVSAPRTGKTIMACAAIIEAGSKALVLAHQTDLIEQFCNETINSPDGSLFDGADFDPPLAGICSKHGDFERYPICLATYQTFLSSGGRRLLGRIKDMFGTVVVDEIHRASARAYSQVLTQFSARRLWGMTATPDRKDALYAISDRIVGPVIHRTDAEVLKPRVGLLDTSERLTGLPRRQPEGFTHIVSMLARNESRNALVAQAASRLIDRGHVVLIPVIRVRQAKDLAKLIDDLREDAVSFQFTGAIPKAKRQEARDRMNSDPSIKAVLATRSMLTGMNIKRWSAIVSQAPIANEPTYEQEVFRICTPMDGKPRPEIIYVFDGDVGIAWPFLHKCKRTLMNPAFGFEPSRRFARLVGA